MVGWLVVVSAARGDLTGAFVPGKTKGAQTPDPPSVSVKVVLPIPFAMEMDTVKCNTRQMIRTR